MHKWFQKPMETVKANPIKRQPLPAAVLERCCNLNSIPRPARPQKHLYVSQLYKLAEPKAMREALISYWLPVEGTIDYRGALFTSMGKLIEDIYVKQLIAADVAKCTDLECTDPEGQHSLRLEELGISGRLDAIVDFNKIKKLGAKTPKKDAEEVEESYWVLNEVKTTGVEKYKFWNEFEKLPEDYLTQFSFYVKYAYQQKLIDKAEGFFTIISRDNFDHRTLWGEPREDLLNIALKNAERFWENVRKRIIPDSEVNPDWVQHQIDSQPDRDWHPLAEVN